MAAYQSQGSKENEGCGAVLAADEDLLGHGDSLYIRGCTYIRLWSCNGYCSIYVYTHLDVNSKLLSLPVMRCLMLADTWTLLKLNPPTPTYSNTITTAAGASAREGSCRIYEATVSGRLWPSSFRPSFTNTHPTATTDRQQLFTRAPSNDTTTFILGSLGTGGNPFSRVRFLPERFSMAKKTEQGRRTGDAAQASPSKLDRDP